MISKEKRAFGKTQFPLSYEFSRLGALTLKNRISLSTGPKLEKLVPLETYFEELKVLRRQISMIPNEKYSKFGSKFLF